jgi:hypothetical protein
MEIVFFIVGSIFTTAGYFILKFSKLGDHLEPIRANVIGYCVDKKSFYPVVEFTHPEKGAQYARWPVGSNTFHLQLGQEVNLGWDVFNKQVRPKTKAFAMFGKVFLGIGLGLVTLFFFIFKFNVFNMGVAVFVVASLFMQVNKKTKQLKRRGVTLEGAIEKFKQEAFQIKSYSSVDEIGFEMLQHYQIQELSRKQVKTQSFAKVFFMVLGISGLFASSYWFQERHFFLDEALKVDAVVVNLVYSRSSDSSVYYPVFEYIVNGEIIQTKYNVGSNPPSYERGEQVVLYYNPNDVKSILVDSGPYMNYLGPSVSFLGSILLLIMGLECNENSHLIIKVQIN